MRTSAPKFYATQRNKIVRTFGSPLGGYRHMTSAMVSPSCMTTISPSLLEHLRPRSRIPSPRMPPQFAVVYGYVWEAPAGRRIQDYTRTRAPATRRGNAIVCDQCQSSDTCARRGSRALERTRCGGDDGGVGFSIFGVRASHLAHPSTVRSGEISSSERRIVVRFDAPGLLVRRSSRWRGESRRRARPWPARGRRSALQQKPLRCSVVKA